MTSDEINLIERIQDASSWLNSTFNGLMVYGTSDRTIIDLHGKEIIDKCFLIINAMRDLQADEISQIENRVAYLESVVNELRGFLNY